MLLPILYGFAYLIGLGLLVMPANSVPVLDGNNATVRMGKHLLGLIFFALGTLKINDVIQEDAGVGFILASAFLILVISVFKTWKNKGKSEEAS